MTTHTGFADRVQARFLSWFRGDPSLLVLSLFCVAVFFLGLGRPALFEPDEGRNAEIAREILLLKDWITPHYNFIPRLDKPAFYYWLVALGYKFFGVSEWSARLPSALTGLGCVFLTYQWTRRFVGSWEALWSGLILAASTEFFIFARTAMLDMSLTFCMTLALFSFWCGTEAPGSRSKKFFFLVTYGAMGIATLIKGPVGFLIPGMVVLLYVLLTRQWSILRGMDLALGTLFFLVIAASWYAAAELRNPGYLRHFLFEQNLLRFLTPTFRRTQPWFFYLAVVPLGFLPWTPLLVPVFARLGRDILDSKIFFLVSWAAFPMLFFSLAQSKLPHYLLPIYPPLAILAGKTIVRILRDAPGHGSRILSLPWLTLTVPLLGVITVLLAPDLFPASLQQALGRYDSAVMLVLVLLALVISIVFAAVDWTRWGKNPGSICVFYGCGLLLWIILLQQMIQGVSYGHSSKEIAHRASELIHPDDRVAIYRAYPSSLPFYLRISRPVWVVWSGVTGTVMGSRYVAEQIPHSTTDYGKVLFSYQEFSPLWGDSKSRLLVFIRPKDLDRLNELDGTSAKKLLQVGDIVLVTNQ